jgi:nucleoid DNA-binding protein
VTFIELVEQISATSGVKKSVVKKVLLDLGSHVRSAVTRGLRVKFQGFGTFYPLPTKEKTLFGGSRRAANRYIIRFKQSRGRKT